MPSTIAASRLERIRLALIGKLMLVALTEALDDALTSEAGQARPETIQALIRLGVTEQQRAAAQAALYDCADGGHSQPFWWRRRPTPLGPTMTAAVAAYRAWSAKQPQQPVVIDLSDTDEMASPPADGRSGIGGYVVDLDDDARVVEMVATAAVPEPQPDPVEPGSVTQRVPEPEPEGAPDADERPIYDPNNEQHWRMKPSHDLLVRHYGPDAGLFRPDPQGLRRLSGGIW